MAIFRGLVLCLLTLFIMSAGALPAAADNIITGCDQGVREKHVQSFPAQAIGKIPDKILNWEVALAKGRYTITVSSYYDFIPFIYTKVNGKYRYAGISRKTQYRTAKNNRVYYTMSFTANHGQSMGRNWWLLQIKPKPHNQNRNHQIQVSIRHVKCPQNNRRNCHCPPGSYEDTNMTFGQSRCIDRRTGREVPMICN